MYQYFQLYIRVFLVKSLLHKYILHIKIFKKNQKMYAFLNCCNPQSEPEQRLQGDLQDVNAVTEERLIEDSRRHHGPDRQPTIALQQRHLQMARFRYRYLGHADSCRPSIGFWSGHRQP
jgi:hypothetical protein